MPPFNINGQTNKQNIVIDLPFQMNIGIWIILAVIVVIIIICIVYCIYNGNCCKKKSEKEYEQAPSNDVENNGGAR